MSQQKKYLGPKLFAPKSSNHCYFGAVLGLDMSCTSFRVNPHSIVCLNVKELLTRSRHQIWSLSDKPASSKEFLDSQATFRVWIHFETINRIVSFCQFKSKTLQRYAYLKILIGIISDFNDLSSMFLFFLKSHLQKASVSLIKCFLKKGVR